MIRELFRLREFRAFMAANAVERFAASAMTVLLGFQIYAITHQTLFLALLGVIEAVPGVTLVLLGGDFADRHDRRGIMLRTTMMLAVLALSLGLVRGFAPSAILPVLFVVAFLSAVVRAFESPAATGLEAQVVPLHLVFRGVPLLATTSRAADVLGPVAVGFAWEAAGPALTYTGLAALFLVATGLLGLRVGAKPPLRTGRSGEGIVARILEGIGYVFREEVLWGSMALDLFAVFFGGATALLPAVATDILHVGPQGFGLMRSAAAAGSLAAAALATRLAPAAARRAGAAPDDRELRRLHDRVRLLAQLPAVVGSTVPLGPVRRDERGDPRGHPAPGLARGAARPHLGGEVGVRGLLQRTGRGRERAAGQRHRSGAVHRRGRRRHAGRGGRGRMASSRIVADGSGAAVHARDRLATRRRPSGRTSCRTPAVGNMVRT